MLAELERFCPNRQRGCLWTGPNEAVEHHLASDCSHKKEEGLGFLKNLVEQLRIDNHALKEEAKKKDEEIHSLKIACSRNSGGEGNEYIMQQVRLDRKLKLSRPPSVVFILYFVYSLILSLVPCSWRKRNRSVRYFDENCKFSSSLLLLTFRLISSVPMTPTMDIPRARARATTMEVSATLIMMVMFLQSAPSIEGGRYRGMKGTRGMRDMTGALEGTRRAPVVRAMTAT